MDWIKNLSRPVKCAVVAAGLGTISVLAYNAYDKYKNKNIPSNVIKHKMGGACENVTCKVPEIIIDTPKLDGNIDNIEEIDGMSPRVEQSIENVSCENEQYFQNEELFGNDLTSQHGQESQQYYKVEESSSSAGIVYSRKEPVEDDSLFDDVSLQKPSRKVLLLGLEKSGKSALLSQLSREGKDCTIYEPTKGFNVVCISFDNIDLSLWEIGGSIEYRSYWKNFSDGVEQIFFVVDSSNRESFEDAKVFLSIVCDELENVSVVIVATKSDDPNSASIEELEEMFGFEHCKIVKVAVHTGGAKQNFGVDKVQQCCLDH